MTLTPQLQYVLKNLELQPTWSEKVGPQYNKIESTDFWTTLHSDGIREFGHVAPAFGGWMSALNNIPLPPGFVKGTITHRGLFLFDESILDWQTGARIAVEFDNRSNGPAIGAQVPQANNSNQINQAEGGMWQVDPGTGLWTDTGVKLVLKPLVWHDLAFESQEDFVARTYGFNAVTLDGVRQAPLKPFQNLPMLELNWAPMETDLQVQQCRQANGVSLLFARDITLTFTPA